MKHIIISLFLLILFASCSTTQRIGYFGDTPVGVPQSIQHQLDLRIKPEDKIMILVNTQDPMLTNLFNLPMVNRTIGSTTTSTSSSSSQGIVGYTVNHNGDIDFPVLGNIHVAGLTREQIAETIKNELTTRNLVKDPVVTVEYQNLSVSVLGEVGAPGRIAIEKDHLTLLEALSQAGDITVQGRRDNVLVQRDENGKKVLYQVDLNSGADLYSSPVYYLQQNDVVYVEPNDLKVRQGNSVNGNTFRSVSFWLSLASFVTTIVVLIVK